MRQATTRKSCTGRNQPPPAFPVDRRAIAFCRRSRARRSPRSTSRTRSSWATTSRSRCCAPARCPTADAGEEERFERERELLMRIKHPAIVDVYDWGHGEDFRYIVTEYFPSGSLELRIRNLMTVKDSVDIFLQIAGALVAVHAAGLCHRDLKPANVMMRPGRPHRADRLRPGEAPGQRRAAHQRRRSARLAVLHQPRAGRRRRRSISAATCTASA